jgi:hypothetical protein
LKSQHQMDKRQQSPKKGEWCNLLP